MASAFVKTGSLWACILGHAFYNSQALLTRVALPVTIEGYNSGTPGSRPAEFQPLWFDLLGVLAVTAGLMWLARVFSRTGAHSELSCADAGHDGRPCEGHELSGENE